MSSDGTPPLYWIGGEIGIQWWGNGALTQLLTEQNYGPLQVLGFSWTLKSLQGPVNIMRCTYLRMSADIPDSALTCCNQQKIPCTIEGLGLLLLKEDTSIIPGQKRARQATESPLNAFWTYERISFAKGDTSKIHHVLFQTWIIS